MRTSKWFVILGALASNIAIVEATETVEIELGKDWYYQLCVDAMDAIDAPRWKDVKVIPYAHAPKIPDGFRSRTEYVLRGKAFEPREFWKKPMAEQLIELKNPILECNLLPIVDKQYDALVLYAISYSVAPTGKPYPIELEIQFEKAVWRVLHVKYDLSWEVFEKSIRSMLIPEDRLYSAPLIVYFADKLAPRYEFHYKSTNKRFSDLTKVVKLPSEFEALTKIPKAEEVVYEKKIM